MQRAQRSIAGLVMAALVVDRVDGDDCVQRRVDSRAQLGDSCWAGRSSFQWYTPQTPNRARTSCRVMRWAGGGCNSPECLYAYRP
jgi:hypothetical protein